MFDCNWIGVVVEVTSMLNGCIRGRVLVPDFIHGFKYTNDAILRKYKVEIGLFL